LSSRVENSLSHGQNNHNPKAKLEKSPQEYVASCVAAEYRHRLTYESHRDSHYLRAEDGCKHELAPLGPDAKSINTVFVQGNQGEDSQSSTSSIEGIEHDGRQDLSVIMGKHVPDPAEALVSDCVVDHRFPFNDALNSLSDFLIIPKSSAGVYWNFIRVNARVLPRGV
jgi:hypothetical protein